MENRNLMNFRVIKYQGSIFTPDFVVPNNLLLLNVVSELLGNKEISALFGNPLQWNPIILPIPQDAPAEIPRIQLNSQDNKWSLNISLLRTDLIYTDLAISLPSIIDDSKFSDIAANFLSRYKEKFDIRVQRAAFVCERILPDDHASNFIVSNFCKDELAQEGRPFNNVNEFELHSLKTYKWEDYHINSWVRIMSRDLMFEKNEPVLLIQNDLNTLSPELDPQRNFSKEEIEMFFQKIPDHLQEILSKYNLK